MKEIGKWICLACFLLLNGTLLLSSELSFGQARVGISGAIEWERMVVNAEISLDLASAGIRLPAGRMQGEAILASEYLRLIRPEIMNIQVDSSSVIGDLIMRGEWSLFELESLVLGARAVPPALSPGFDRLSATYTLGIAGISEAFIRHRQPMDVPRTLNPISVPAFTGIIIVASDMQQVHGREGRALIRPALFPRIWDTQMNLIFERNMLDPAAGAMVRYFCRQGIFAGGPTGLSPEVAAVVGDRPLRIFARGAFGATPTDPIISREDALQIISRPENRDLLRNGRVAIILDDSMLRSSFRGQ
ncbi:MAG: polymerase [Treponema sp.]|nr:polymerase [Treponema sp.]